MSKTIGSGHRVLARTGSLIALIGLAAAAFAAQPAAPGGAKPTKTPAAKPANAPPAKATRGPAAKAPRAPAEAANGTPHAAVAAAASASATLPAAAAPGSDAATPAAPQGLGIGTPTTTELAGGPQAPIVLETGLYRCELNRNVLIRAISQDRRSMVINWLGKDHALDAVDALSGALRYEDASAGLVWLAIVGKSMLLDSRKGQQLANECKL